MVIVCEQPTRHAVGVDRHCGRTKVLKKAMSKATHEGIPPCVEFPRRRGAMVTPTWLASRVSPVEGGGRGG